MSPLRKRRHKRYEVTNVQGSLLFKVKVTVTNISLNGLAVETNQPLRLGKSYSLKLTNDRDALDLEGVVRWCHLARTSRLATGEALSVYRAGLTFDGILTQKAARLMAFMEEHVVVSLEKRILGRFKLNLEGPASLESKYDFEVVKLSLGGMLIKTRLLPAVDSVFDMEIHLESGLLELQGRVAYTERIGGGEPEPLSQLGVEFRAMAPPVEAKLKEFIATVLE